MSIGYIRALRILHSAFSTYPMSHRVHMLIRFFTCPFPRTIDVIPVGARVLEIGSGHALYARLIVEERAREVVAVEPDIRKSLLPSPSPKIHKVAAFDDAVNGTFDAVVMYDMTYRLPLTLRREIFERAFKRLTPGGLLVFKDMDGSARLKMKWARFQEWLSDSFLHISIGSGFIYQTPAEVRAMLESIGFTDFQNRDIGAGYPHPHMIYTARKPQ